MTLDLDRLSELAETPGPWRWDETHSWPGRDAETEGALSSETGRGLYDPRCAEREAE